MIVGKRENDPLTNFIDSNYLVNSGRSLIPKKLGGYFAVMGGFNITLTNNYVEHYVESAQLGSTIVYRTTYLMCNPNDGVLQTGVVANNYFEWDGSKFMDTLMIGVGIENEFGRPIHNIV